jgi:hypothetical protein
MATFKEALQYAQQNPTSDFAKQLETGIKSGQFLDVAKSEGVDLSPFVQKTPTQSMQSESDGIKGIPGVAVGAAKGVGSTIKGLGELSGKILSPIEKGIGKLTGMTPEKKAAIEQAYGLPKGGDVFTPGSEQNIKATELTTANTGAEKLGKTVEQVAEFFVPAGKVAQVEKVLATGASKGVTQKLIPLLGEEMAKRLGGAAELGTKVAVRVGEGAGVTAVQTGGDMEAISSGAKGGAIFSALSPVIGAVAGPSLKFVKNIGTRVAGGLTSGTKVIEAVIDNPRAALEGLNNAPIESLRKNESVLRNAVGNLQKKASVDYELALSSIDDAYKYLKINPNDPKYFFEISNKLGSKADDLLKQSNVETIGGKLDFSSSPLVGAEEGIVQKAYNVFTKHDDYSARGLETLAQKLRQFKKPSTDFADSNRIVQGLINEAISAVQEKASMAGLTDIAEMTKKYAKAKDKIDVYDDLFKVSTSKNVSESERNAVIKKLDDLLSGQKDVEVAALKEIGLDDVLGREAGRLVQEDVSRSVSSIGDVARTVVSTVIPPKTIGKIVANLSLGQDSAKNLISKLEKMSPALRGAFIKAIVGPDSK